MTRPELWVTGGHQRPNGVWVKEFQLYDRALLAQVDPAARSVVPRLEHLTPPELCADGTPSIVFKSASLVGGLLYLCTETEVLIYRWPELTLVKHLSHPCFNDVHHVAPGPDGLYVVSTGLDMVVRFDEHFEVREFLPAVDEAPFTRFSREIDYRKVPDTKPHACHPNFVFFLDGEPFVSRCTRDDAVAVRDHSRRIDVGVGHVHDGIVEGDYVYFTTVNGYVVVAHARTLKVEARYELAPMSGATQPLGWCRGLKREGDTWWVGFSRLRPTRLYQNLRWLKHQLLAPGEKPPEALPTRIARYDLSAGRLLEEIVLEEGGVGAVFSILGG